MMAHMYGGTILLVDLTEGQVSREPTTSYSGTFLGGRGINAKILYDGVPPEIAPLDPANILIFGVGPLSGTPVPAGRTEVTARSPETGFLGSSNFGGSFGPELKYAGYDHIVITGRADQPVYLWIENDRVEIRDATDIWGKDTYQTQAIIRSQLDPEAKLACIGQAGENLVHFATVQSELGHAAGRTGMGAVMGSKNLKAIAVRGTKQVSLANPERYLQIAEELQQEMKNHPGVKIYQQYGLSALQNTMGEVLKEPEERRRAHPHDLTVKYNTTRAGCFGCPAQCMDLYPVEAKGGGVISCELHAEPFGTVGNTDLDLGLECSLLAQRYGVDSVTSMMTIGWLMELYENGVITAKDTDGIAMEWGSPEAITGMFRKMVYREGFGDVLADGIRPAAERIGRGAIDYARQVKGMPTNYLYSAASKTAALGMATGTRGDLMRSTSFGFDGAIGLLPLLYDEKTAAEYEAVIREKAAEITGTDKALRSRELEGKAELVAFAEDETTICDCLSACKMIGTGWFGIRPYDTERRAALLSAGTGVDTSVDTLFQFARRIRNLERAYNVRQGMTRDMDTLPKRFMDQPTERRAATGSERRNVLKSSDLEKLKDRYYALRGWDVTTGIPTRQTLKKTGLEDVARDLKKRGKLPEMTGKK